MFLVLLANDDLRSLPPIYTLLSHFAEFNAHQRQVFCVFSGNGVNQLRDYLSTLAPNEATGNTTEDEDHSTISPPMELDDDDQTMVGANTTFLGESTIAAMNASVATGPGEVSAAAATGSVAGSIGGVTVVGDDDDYELVESSTATPTQNQGD